MMEPKSQILGSKQQTWESLSTSQYRTKEVSPSILLHYVVYFFNLITVNVKHVAVIKSKMFKNLWKMKVCIE